MLALETIAERLKEYHRSTGRKKQWTAEQAGIRNDKFSRILSGKQCADTATIARLEKVTGLVLHEEVQG